MNSTVNEPRIGRLFGIQLGGLGDEPSPVAFLVGPDLTKKGGSFFKFFSENSGKFEKTEKIVYRNNHNLEIFFSRNGNLPDPPDTMLRKQKVRFSKPDFEP